MKRDLAKRVSDRAVMIQSELNDLVRVLELEGDVDEFRSYRLKIGSLMASLYSDILSPIYKEYPEMIPPEMR